MGDFVVEYDVNHANDAGDIQVGLFVAIVKDLISSSKFKPNNNIDNFNNCLRCCHFKKKFNNFLNLGMSNLHKVRVRMNTKTLNSFSQYSC